MRTLLFCWLIFMRMVERTKRLTKEVPWRPIEQRGPCVVCTNEDSKDLFLSFFALFQESCHKILIKL